MFEVELRAKVKDLKKVERDLIFKGAKPVKEVKQRDRIFGHKMFLDENRFICDGGLSARIRSVGKSISLEFKEIKRQSGGREWKINLTDEEDGFDFLKKLGFEEAFMLEKNRQEFLFDGFTICLDKVEELGEFIEIEKEIPNAAEKEATWEACQEILTKIVPNAVIEPKKYGDLIQEKINSKK